MAKPRVFVSSTYYDLKYIRDGIEAFVNSIGYETVLFEKGDIPFHPDKALEDSCYQEVEGSDILVLIIGGRYGGLSREDQEKIKQDPEEYIGRIRSITNKEYQTARARGVATFIFVDQNVYSEYRTYLENKGTPGVKYAHVDDPRIYQMIDDILAQKNGNYVKGFAKIEDITGWLRDQWAGLFGDFLKKRNSSEQLKNLQNQVSDLTEVVSTLKKYSEAIIKQVNKPDASKIIESENKRVDATRAKRVMAESLISYMLERYEKHFNGHEILLKIRASSSLLDFLDAFGLTKEQVADFVEKHELVAEREWRHLKKGYDQDKGGED